MADEDISILTLQELRGLLLGRFPIPREVSSARKEVLVAYIESNASQDILDLLRIAAKEKVDAKRIEGNNKKRKRDHSKYIRRVVNKIEPSEEEDEEIHDINRFLEFPGPDETKGLYRKFYLATSNAAVAMAVCGDIPNSHRLVPRVGHPAHELCFGKLLDSAGLVQDGDVVQVKLCPDCLGALRDNKDSPPSYSLANNLWIGRRPWELQVLTFPEQLLVALLYPRVYVFKLYPKSRGPKKPEELQRGMRGTVTTYDLDIEGISAMVGGDLMPRPPEVLASVISVTYVGLGELPKNWINNTFRVRRDAVRRALCWLKTNNPKYYGHIQIDEARLRALPEDDMPLAITSVIRQSTDTGIIDQESDGYVPRHEEFESANGHGLIPNASFENELDVGQTESDDPDVIPLNFTGTVDSDLSKLSANEMMAWGLMNLWKEDKEGGYAVRHGRIPVNDFGQSQNPEEALDPDRPNFFEKAFPCLFPYGRGGLEADRPVKLGFGDHIKWLLQYHDRRFRRHETFPFVVFGILQRRQALMSARIQMRRKNFEKDARILATITTAKLEQASREEEQRIPISDPAVRLLRQHVHAAPWSLWITINPIDIHDPIAQIFVGEDINLDHFVASVGPDKDKRAANIALDPYAAAKFFHFMLRTILETLFGVESTAFQFRSSMGILGEIAAYYAMVEAQNRAALHGHMLVALKHTPNPDQILELLKQESFRAKISAYIQANLRAYLPGLETAESVKQIPVEKEIAYNRPPNPDAADYDAQIRDFELRLARTEQTHTCELRRCLIPTKTGYYRCKRRAPFPRSMEDSIDESGKWTQKRLYEFMNSWNPGILVNVRCNNDIKLLTNGSDTQNVTFYIAGSYAAKPQQKAHNLSAILAKGYAYHLANLGGRTSEKYVDDLRNMQRLLLFRLVHTINREQELGAPMVISYLMGWGDKYRSHRYVPIYWSSFIGALFRVFPELKQVSSLPQNSDRDIQPAREDHLNDDEQSIEQTEQVENREAEDGNDLVTLAVNPAGGIITKCQISDYSARGDELSSYNIIDFFVDTYEVDIAKEVDTEIQEVNVDGHRRPGRPKNARVRYQPPHPAWRKKERVVRSRGHNTLPNFIGSPFPQRNDPEIHDFYCAAMLVLLKPWRDLGVDLKATNETWSQAFDKFLASANPKVHDILAGIQYFYSCRSAALANRNADDEEQRHTVAGPNTFEDLGEDIEFTISGYSEEGLAQLIASQIPIREELHARMAMEFARAADIFANDSSEWALVPGQPVVTNATGSDMANLVTWRNQLAQDVQIQNSVPEFVEAAEQLHDSADVIQMDHFTAVEPQVTGLPITSGDTVLTAAPLSELKPDQRRAYEIIIWHLDATLAGKEPPPLRMGLYGEGEPCHIGF
ncbi:hypothetical protein K438DRAFT_1968205 [Mycena galopus ATCC 62051]|nr:hypothetical protein K438DRAFT_1968205 [Mycena galopus ATCC 62051]